MTYAELLDGKFILHKLIINLLKGLYFRVFSSSEQKKCKKNKQPLKVFLKGVLKVNNV